MITHSRKKDIKFNILLLLLFLLPIVVSFILKTNGKAVAFGFHESLREIRVPCVFKDFTGYNCPACGGTRSFIYMSSFELKAAWGMNKATTLLYVFCMLQIPYRLALIFCEKIPFHTRIIQIEAVMLISIGIIDALSFISQFIFM
ncbi:MAG: DUF2752 domain-containing protein [Bacillota bacterium]|nr:DUF2752 domain-containing protein [Bacillota bacterium]